MSLVLPITNGRCLVIRAINKVMAPISRRVNLMVARGVLALVDDATKMQGMQIKLLDGEVREMERFQNYGLTSQPLPGAEVAAMFIGGNRNHGLIVAVDDRRFRLKGLVGGEVALYDDLGHVVKLTRTGIEVDGGGHNLTIINTPIVKLTGGDFEADGIRLKDHHHDEHDGPASSKAKA